MTAPPAALDTVTLVIDDGPSDATARMLDALESAGHRAVLFLLGTNIAGREAVLVDAIHRGFALGNHSFSHPRFSEIDVATARHEIVRTDALIDDLYRRAGRPRPGRWFRFPYLDTGARRHDDFQRLLAELGFAIPISIRDLLPEADRARRDWPSTLVTRDWALPPEPEFRATVEQARPGDVVEYHDKIDTVDQLSMPLIRALGQAGVRAAVPPRGIRRVLLVSWWLDRLGGMERHIAELAGALIRAGVDVEYLSEMPLPSTNVYRRRLESLGVRIHAPGRLLHAVNLARRGVCRVPSLRPLVDRPQADPIRRLIDGDLLGGRLIEALDAAIDRAPVDAIHIHGIRLGQAWLIEWARSRGVRVMYTEHVAIADMGGPWDPTAPAIAARADVLACVSEHSRESLLSVLPEPRPIAVTHHIVAPPTEQGTPTSPFHWLSVARLARYKGIDVLLEAFAACVRRDDRFRLTLAGEGAELGALEAQAEELGIASHVDFLGMVAPEDLALRYQAAAGVVAASRTEGLPVSLVEALAHGKAIVATRVGGIPELLTDWEDALLVPPEDPDALAQAMQRISTDDGLRTTLEGRARDRFRASSYHESAVVRSMLALYGGASS